MQMNRTRNDERRIEKGRGQKGCRRRSETHGAPCTVAGKADHSTGMRTALPPLSDYPFLCAIARASDGERKPGLRTPLPCPACYSTSFVYNGKRGKTAIKQVWNCRAGWTILKENRVRKSPPDCRAVLLARTLAVAL